MPHNRFLSIVLLVLLMGSDLAAEEPEATSILQDVIFSTAEADPPLWVAAEAAETANGEVDWDLLGPGARSLYEGIRDGAPIAVRQPDGSYSADGPAYDDSISGVRPECIYYGPSWVDRYGPAPDSSVSDLVRHARAVADLEVEQIHAGFFRGQPSSLLQARVRGWLRISEGLGAQESLFVPFPKAQFTVGDQSFCKGDPGIANLPAPGDRLLLFVYRPPSDGAGIVVDSPPSHLLLIDQKDSTYRSLGELADEVSLDLQKLFTAIESGLPDPQSQSSEGSPPGG